jgi:hypothetical protein
LPRMIGHTPLLPGSDTDLENGKKNKNEWNQLLTGDATPGGNQRQHHSIRWLKQSRVHEYIWLHSV